MRQDTVAGEVLIRLKKIEEHVAQATNVPKLAVIHIIK